MSYRNGYSRGRSDGVIAQNRAVEQERQLATAHANNGAALGITLGMFIIAAVGAVGALLYFGTDSSVTSTESDSAPENVESETTIIERTVERTQDIVPVPSEISIPEVDIQLPDGANGESAPSDESNPVPDSSSTSESSNNENASEPTSQE